MNIAIDADILAKALWQYVVVGSGLPEKNVIFAEQAGPSPSGVYATILPMNTVQMGTAQTVYRKDGEIDYSILNILSSSSIQFFRKGAMNLASLFRAFANSPQGAIEAQKRGLTFCKTSPVRSLDRVVSHVWEPRAGLDLEMAFAQRFRNFHPNIESIVVTLNGVILEEIRHES